MDDLTKRLWESDAASALTNEAARRIEADAARIRELEALVSEAREPIEAAIANGILTRTELAKAEALLARMEGEHDRS